MNTIFLRLNSSSLFKKMYEFGMNRMQMNQKQNEDNELKFSFVFLYSMKLINCVIVFHF